MTRKPIVKIVRAVTLIPGDEFYLTAKSPRSVVHRTKKINRGVVVVFRVFGSSREGVAKYNRAVMAYKIVGWSYTTAQGVEIPIPVNEPKGGQIAGSGFMRTIEALAVMSDPFKTRPYAEPLHVRQQKEINELKAALQSAMDVNAKHVASLVSMQEECDLKAQAIDELNSALEEKSRGNAALNGTICGLRHKLTNANNSAAEQYNLNTRLHSVVNDITQRLEDFRDGE